MANLFLNNVGDSCVHADNLDILSCVKRFDSGRRNIYIVDENNRYTGLAITRNTFLQVWQNGKFAGVNLAAVDISLLNDNVALNKYIEGVLQLNPSAEEFPVTQDGKIVYSLCATEQTFEYDWKPFYYQWPTYFSRYRKIFISSLESKAIRNFHNSMYNLFLFPLMNDNIEEAFSADNLLIYDAPIFPERAQNKMHYSEVFEMCRKTGVQNCFGRVSITDDVAHLTEKEVCEHTKLIAKFDEGYRTVVVDDDNGNFKGVAAISTFRGEFPARNFPIWNNLFLPYQEDEDAIKEAAAEMFFGTARQEMPILKDGKAIAAATLDNYTFRGMSEKELTAAKKVDWSIITDETAKNFFAERHRILISSLTGNLDSFFERFKDILDITVYDSSLIEKYYSREFDALIFVADFWGRSPCIKYEVNRLYRRLIAEQLSQIEIIMYSQRQ